MCNFYFIMNGKENTYSTHIHYLLYIHIIFISFWKSWWASSLFSTSVILVEYNWRLELLWFNLKCFHALGAHNIVLLWLFSETSNITLLTIHNTKVVKLVILTSNSSCWFFFSHLPSLLVDSLVCYFRKF